MEFPSEQSVSANSKKKSTKKKSQKAAEKEVQLAEGTSGVAGEGESNVEKAAEKAAGQKRKRGDQGGVTEQSPVPPPSLRATSKGPVRFPAH